MRLTIFNGSPKHGSKNNTSKMIESFKDGFLKQEGNKCDIYKLNEFKNMDEAVDLYRKSEKFILAFPLYAYSMPGGTKRFIEALEPLCGDGMREIGFLVQYGFIEAIHARPLEEYLVKLVSTLGQEYLGTIIKGGCDGITNNPEAKNTKKILNGVYEIGEVFGKTGYLDTKLLNKFSKPEKQTVLSKIGIRFYAKLANKYFWSAELKKNGVFEDSFARPYEKV